jgi:hypothetical protein
MKRLIGVCLILAGCATPADGTGPYPANYRQIVSEHVRATFFDPYSIRDAQIAAPKADGAPVLTPGWVVCMRANAKNRLGAYIGPRETAFIISGGRVVNTLEETGHLFCAGSRYELL